MANNNTNSDELKAKRKRSVNWDILEKSLLKSCMKEFVSIIENKNTDTNTNKNKTIAWQAVAKRFNELNNRERQMTEIKQQWRTMKLDAKKNMSQVKTSIKCTGGGPKPPSPDPETMEILTMIPQEFETDSNVFDSDGIANKAEVEEESLVSVTQEYVLTPLNNQENIEENITPIPIKKVVPKNLSKPQQYKRKLGFDEVKDNEHKTKREDTELARERHYVLVKCIKEEHDVKMKNMSEAHSFIKEEHNLKIKQILLEKEETQLRIEKLKLEMLLLQSQLT